MKETRDKEFNNKGDNPSFILLNFVERNFSWRKDSKRENPYLVVAFYTFQVLSKTSPEPPTQTRREDDAKFLFLKLA